MKNFLLIALALGLLIGGGYLAYTKIVGENLVDQADITGKQRTELNLGENTIEIKDYKYTPKTLTIKAGESVTWINKDAMQHDATADDQSWKINLMAQGESQTYKFSSPGTYTYHCSPHPWMKGTIIVE